MTEPSELSELNELMSTVEALRGEELDALSDAAAEEAFLWVDRARELVELERARRLADLERRGIHARDGHLSVGAWLATRTGSSIGAAKASVAFARSLAAMPLAVAAVGDGSVSLDAARVLAETQRIDPEAFAASEATLVDAARIHPVRELRHVCAFWRERVEAERMPDAEARRMARRRLHASSTLGGTVRVDGDLDAHNGEPLLAALSAVLDAEARAGGIDQRTPAQARADALGEICRAYLDRSDRPEVAGERPHINVTVPIGSLTGGSSSPPAEAERMGPIAAEVVRTLACDASVARIVVDPPSEPLDVGRRTPVVPAGLRRAVAERDRTCRFPECDRPQNWCDAHHVVHWADGGPTSIDNLLLLCRRHHRLVHAGFGTAIGRGRVVFSRPDGSVLAEEPLAMARSPG